MEYLIIKWGGKEYRIEGISGETSVLQLKQLIQEQTEVRPERQKLLNLKLNGKPPGDEILLSSLPTKNGAKIMMMGSLEKDILASLTPPSNLPYVRNDLDDTDEETAVEFRPENLAKVQHRIEKCDIQIRNAFRPGKKLLVLDIDYTLFDHRSTGETARFLMRPYLHEFLTSAFKDYDIAIWSATSLKWIKEKMRLLGCDAHTDYKLAFFMDCRHMISVHTQKYGVVEVKPLGVIWGKFPTVHQGEHHYARRPPTKLPHEPSKRP
uniref:Ubiquitin-like domain-containing CTD phosphatase 1 n=1 Tax=Caligus rogercresseyi TaxID=217165 RepID=C1BRQ0_CALRO|nr:Ubiquitin-like domain-containing CTD phosphatase 1 [Caligus rogercresseyi]